MEDPKPRINSRDLAELIINIQAIKINNFGHSLKQSLKQNTNLSDISTFLTDLYQTLKQTIINNIKNTNLQNTFNAKLKKIIDNFLNNKNIKAPNDYFKLNLFNKLTKLPNNIDVRIIKIYN